MIAFQAGSGSPGDISIAATIDICGATENGSSFRLAARSRKLEGAILIGTNFAARRVFLPVVFLDSRDVTEELLGKSARIAVEPGKVKVRSFEIDRGACVTCTLVVALLDSETARFDHARFSSLIVDTVVEWGEEDEGAELSTLPVRAAIDPYPEHVSADRRLTDGKWTASFDFTDLGQQSTVSFFAMNTRTGERVALDCGGSSDLVSVEAGANAAFGVDCELADGADASDMVVPVMTDLHDQDIPTRRLFARWL